MRGRRAGLGCLYGRQGLGIWGLGGWRRVLDARGALEARLFGSEHGLVCKQGPRPVTLLPVFRRLRLSPWMRWLMGAMDSHGSNAVLRSACLSCSAKKNTGVLYAVNMSLGRGMRTDSPF